MGNDNKSCSTGACETGKCGKMMMPMIIVLVLVVAGVFVYANSSKENSENISLNNDSEKSPNHEKNNMMDDKKEWTEEEMKEMEKMEESETKKMNEKTEITNVASKTTGYNDYTPELLSANKTNILFFAATWCPSCQGADKNFMSETIPENINLLKVDYDTYSDLKQKYSITMQHTYVQVDVNGKEIKKWSGSTNVADILKEI